MCMKDPGACMAHLPMTARSSVLDLCCPADHYVAKMSGMLPEDPWAAAQADQIYYFLEDIWQTM